jgi:phage replication O-like protein O
MALNSLNHTQLSNEFIDNYLDVLSGNAIKLFLIVTRKTVGWHKKTDRIALSQFEKLSGLALNTIKAGLDELVLADIITQEWTPLGYVYEIKYVDKEVSTSDTMVSIIDDGVSNIDTVEGQSLTPQKKGNKLNKIKITNKNNKAEKYKDGLFLLIKSYWLGKYQKAYNTKYFFKGHEADLLFDLTKEFNEQDIIKKIDLYFDSLEWFAKNKEIKYFVNNWNSLIDIDKFTFNPEDNNERF